MKRKFRFLVLVVLSLLVPAKGLMAKPSLEVKNLSVEFLPDNKIHVKGEFCCRDIKGIGGLSISTGVVVDVDFPHGAKGFSLLPDSFSGLGVSSDDRNDPGVQPYMVCNGMQYREGQETAIIYNSTFTIRPMVLDKDLDNETDDGRWIAFDKTLNFNSGPSKNRELYRILIGWKAHWRYDFFNHKYFWVTYGPFPWGVAPLCNKSMTATHYRHASFTEKGVVIKESAAPPEEPRDKPPVDEGNGEKPKLVRPSKQPTHLEAIDAAELLKTKLAELPGIEGSGVGLPPKFALVRISYSAGMKPDALTRLVARVALETAYCAPWVETMKIAASGDQGSSMVTVTWTPTAKYSAKEITLEDFCKTWQVSGKALVIPKAR